MKPFFTVLIPVYNVQDYIESTLKSVIDQTFSDLEILVINDGSTDKTLDIVHSVNDSRIRILHHENHGVSYTRNRGIREAEGKYIAFLDGDDQWCKRHLEIAFECLKSQPNLKWYASPFKYVAAISPGMLDFRPVCKSHKPICYFTSGYLYAWSSSTIIEHDALHSVMDSGIFFPEDMTHGEDLAAWVRFAISFPILATNHQVTSYCLLRQESALGSMKGMAINLKMTDSLSVHFSKYIKLYSCSLKARLFMKNQLLVRWMIQLKASNLSEWIKVLIDTKNDTPWIVRKWVRIYVSCIKALESMAYLYIKIFLKTSDLLLLNSK